MAAAGSRLIVLIAPTDVVDADDDRFPPSSQIILLVKTRCKNQRTRFELLPKIGGNRRCWVWDFAPLKVVSWPLAALSR
jgi:hypothetical protein